MEDNAIEILGSHRILAISTLRPDGWPQTTIVGYANDALAIYFLIFRSSQKFANIRRDGRVSIAVGEEPRDMREAKAVFAGAIASEVVDPKERKHAWGLLVQQHPNLAHFDLPASAKAAIMRADCKHVSVLDYAKGFGHTETFSTDKEESAPRHRQRKEAWGASLSSDI